MNVANPGMLPFVLLAAAPVVVHLFFRRRTRRIVFPSLRLLKTVDPRMARRRRLRERVLLALRCAVLLVAALAISRPFLGSAPAGTGASDTVFLLDDSASMAGQAGLSATDSPAFADAVAAVRQSVGAMHAGDRAAIHRVVAGPLAPKEGLTQDAGSLARALEGAARSDGRGSLAGALSRAGAALAKGTSPARRLVLVTDLDAGAFGETALSTAARNLPPGTDVVVARVGRGAPPADVSISNLTAGRGVCVVGRTLEVRVTVARRGGAPGAVTVRLAANGKAPDAREVDVPATGTAEARFEVVPADAGPLALEASIGRGERDAGDAFPPNDRRFLVLEARRSISVALADGDLAPGGGGRGGALLAMALDPRGDGSLTGITVRRRAPAELETSTVVAADLLILHDAPDLSDDAANAWAARAREGAGLLVFAGPRSAAAGRAVPVPLLETVPAEGLAPLAGTPAGSAAEAAPVVVAADRDDALAGLRRADGPARLEGITVRGAPTATPRAGATVLLEAGGRPIAMRSESGAGRGACVWVSTSLDPAATNFALRPSFLAFVHGALPLLLAGAGSRPSFVAGEAGPPRPVFQAGVYDLEKAGASFAVNVDLREADPLRLDPAAAAARILATARPVPASDLVEALSKGGRADLTGWFLLLVAAILLAETVIANAPRVRATATTATKSKSEPDAPPEREVA